MHKRRNVFRKRPYRWLFSTLLLLTLLAACSLTPEVVEVTRVVTETEIIEVPEEAVEVEVTRVVTETVTETVVEEVEAEEEPAPPSATGSEDDSGPLPPAPDDGPKVTSRGGTTSGADGAETEIVQETAVPRRSNPFDETNTPQTTLVATIFEIDATEWQKLCQLAQATFKKRCD